MVVKSQDRNCKETLGTKWNDCVPFPNRTPLYMTQHRVWRIYHILEHLRPAFSFFYLISHGPCVMRGLKGPPWLAWWLSHRSPVAWRSGSNSNCVSCRQKGGVKSSGNKWQWALDLGVDAACRSSVSWGLDKMHTDRGRRGSRNILVQKLEESSLSDIHLKNTKDVDID